jgi:hypothetical protein
LMYAKISEEFLNILILQLRLFFTASSSQQAHR